MLTALTLAWLVAAEAAGVILLRRKEAGVGAAALIVGGSTFLAPSL